MGNKLRLYLKKYWWAIIIVVIAIPGLLWWYFSSSIKKELDDLKPRLRVVSFSITDIQEERVKSTLGIILSNSLPVEINIPKLVYNIFVDSLIVIESVYNKPIHIDASGDSRIILPMETLSEPTKRLLKLFDEQNRDSAVYTFNAAFSVDVPILGVRDFTIHEEKRMPAFRIPKIKIDKVDVDKLGFDESRLSMMVHIENPSLFSLKMKNAGYTFNIDKVLELEGTVEEIINLPPRGSQSLPMILDIKTAKIVRLTWKVLFEKKHTDFKMNFHGKIISTDKSVSNSTLTIAIDGTLDELRNLKEEK